MKFKTTRDGLQALENVPRGTISSVECQLLSDMKNPKNNIRRLIDSVQFSRPVMFLQLLTAVRSRIDSTQQTTYLHQCLFAFSMELHCFKAYY